MKKEMTLKVRKQVSGYELLSAGVPSGLARELWSGSPWRALRDSIRRA